MRYAIILIVAMILSPMASAYQIDCTQSLGQQELEIIKKTLPTSQIQQLSEICSAAGDELAKKAHLPDDGRTDRIQLLLEATTAYSNATGLALIIAEIRTDELKASLSR